MKVWIKYLIGITIGVAASFLIPVNTAQAQSLLDFIADLSIRFGRFCIIPLIVFSVSTAAFKLREKKLLLKSSLWTFGFIVVSSLSLVIIGLLSALLVRLPRIPITIEKVNSTQTLDIKALLSSIFPYSGFQSLLDGAFLLPATVLAFLAGAGAASDPIKSKAAMSFFDSMSHVCYKIMEFSMDLLAIGLIAISFKWTVDFVTIVKASVYNPLLMMFTVDLLIVAFIIYPVLIRVVCHDKHPFRVLYASVPSFMIAFFSGDSNVVLPVNIRHGKESLGIRRKINAVSFPLFSIFARGGAALTCSASFILILRSYSSLNINTSSVFWIGSMAFLLSFVLGNIPVRGPFFALTVMFNMYGAGFDAGYLLLKDAAPLICCFAAGIDAITAMVGSYIISVKTKNVERKEIKKFI